MARTTVLAWRWSTLYIPQSSSGWVAEWSIAHAWKACLGESLTRVRIPLSPPLPCREPTIGRPQARKAPSSRAIFQMPSEPRRLRDTSKAVSERNLSLITRTPPSAVRVQNSLRLQRFGPIDGPEVRGRYSTQCAVRETEVEVLARNSGRACPFGRQSPAWSTAPTVEAARWHTPKMALENAVH